MEWVTSNDHNGVWEALITDEDMDSPPYGPWPIGDKVPVGEPGHHENLMVKRWYGHPDKYRHPGHQVPAGAHNDRWEYVLVTSGCLQCIVDGQSHSLTYPNDIRLPPTVERTWILPVRYEWASGITVCYRPIYDGHGLTLFADFEMHLLDIAEDALLASPLPAWLHQPERLAMWSWQCIVMFSGEIDLLFGNSRYCADQQRVIFTQSNDRPTGFITSPPARGAVFYY